jgi:hypothetical protein
MKYAIINENKVTSIVELFTEEEVIDYTKKNQLCYLIDDLADQNVIGYDFVDNTLKDLSGNLVKQKMRMTRLAFRNRFTTNELVALYTEMQSNIMLQIINDNLLAATFIDLNRAETINAVYYIASLGVITNTRAGVILTTTPSELEVYKAIPT